MTGGRNKGADALTSANAPRPVSLETTTSVASFQWHTVKRNESLDDIARQYAVSVDQLRKLNSLSTVKFGMRLKVRML